MSKEEATSNNNSEEENNNEFELVLRLYVTGASSNSIRAISNLKQICEKYIKGKYSLEIIDVYQQKELAEIDQIIALPLLIKTFPLPQRRLIGDMSDQDKVLRGLGITQS
jgi:circadian clock protein KaiB